MRLKSSNSLFRTLLWLVCFWFTASAQEGYLLYGAEDSEREIKVILFSQSSVKISAVGIGTLGTTDSEGKLKIESLKVEDETLILKFQKEGYLERTKILRLTDTKKKEFTQTIILEPDKSTTTEATKAQVEAPKTQEGEKEEFIKLRIPKEKISKLSSGGIDVPIEGELKEKIRELLSDESNKIDVSISLEKGEPVAKIRLGPIQQVKKAETIQQAEASGDPSGKCDAQKKIAGNQNETQQQPPSAGLNREDNTKLLTVNLTIQVNYKEELLFSTPGPFSRNWSSLRSAFAINGISLPQDGPIDELEPNKSWRIKGNNQIYVLHQEKEQKGGQQLYIYQEGKPVANALVQINENKGETKEDGRVTLSGVSVPTTGKLNVTVSKGLMYKEEVKEINLNSPEPIVVTLDPKQWIEIQVFGKKAEPLSNAKVWLDRNQHLGTTDQMGKIIIPVNPSAPPSNEYSISVTHEKYGAWSSPTPLIIPEHQKIYLYNITVEQH